MIISFFFHYFIPYLNFHSALLDCLYQFQSAAIYSWLLVLFSCSLQVFQLCNFFGTNFVASLQCSHHYHCQRLYFSSQWKMFLWQVVVGEGVCSTTWMGDFALGSNNNTLACIIFPICLSCTFLNTTFRDILIASHSLTNHKTLNLWTCSICPSTKDNTNFPSTSPHLLCLIRLQNFQILQ